MISYPYDIIICKNYDIIVQTMISYLLTIQTVLYE